MPSKKLAKLETVSLARSSQILNAGLKALADFVSGPIAPPEMAGTFAALKDAEKVVADLKDNLKDRLMQVLRDDGEVTTEKGTMCVVAGDWQIEARPMKSGFDPKKVEGLLRAKGLNPGMYMDQIVTYAVNEDKMVSAAVDGAITQDEASQLKFELKYAFQTPKKVGSNE